MNILALDLGTKCGWAHSNGNSGTWLLKAKTTESAGQRYVNFERCLIGVIKGQPLDLIVYEAIHAHVGVEAAHVFGGLQAILQSFCIRNKIEYRGIGVGTIKKHATGKGNAKKDEIIFAASLKFKNINVTDDNHADALWLLDLATNQACLTES